jgi:hypothetical protein
MTANQDAVALSDLERQFRANSARLTNIDRRDPESHRIAFACAAKRARLLEAIAEHPIHSAQDALIVARLSLDALGPVEEATTVTGLRSVVQWLDEQAEQR